GGPRYNSRHPLRSACSPIGLSCMAADAPNTNGQHAEGPAHAVYWLLHYINLDRLDGRDCRRRSALQAQDATLVGIGEHVQPAIGPLAHVADALAQVFEQAL